MTVSIITLLVSWIVFSTLLVTVILIGSSRSSHSDDRFEQFDQIFREAKMKADDFASSI